VGAFVDADASTVVRLNVIRDKARRVRDALGRFTFFDALDAALVETLRQIIAASNVDLWRTAGRAAATDWSPHDLIETGELQRSMESPHGFEMVVDRQGIAYWSNAYSAFWALEWGDYKRLTPGAYREIRQTMVAGARQALRDAWKGGE
jgi:hypothetical protein